MLTPWKLKSRIEYLRARARTRSQAKEWSGLLAFEEGRRRSRREGRPIAAEQGLGLFDAALLSRLTGRPAAMLTLSAPSPSFVIDRRTAAAFVIDLWRTRQEVRNRFPALFRSIDGGFLTWLHDECDPSLALPIAAIGHIEGLFAQDYSARARQVFLANVELRAVLPHGLTPPGMASLFRWFARVGMAEEGLLLEEVAWLFLGAAQSPAEELLLAHSFTPAWQRLHPDGITIFGREAFAQWFGHEYGVNSAWLSPAQWPEWVAPATHLRTSYWARPEWRSVHPHALASEASAVALLDWLAASEAPICEGARAWCARHRSLALATSLIRPGVNVIGHFTYPSGLRVSVESLVQAVKTAGVEVSLRDVRTDAKDDPHHVEFRGTECHDVTVIHTQPQPYFDDAYARADLAPREPRTYRVAYWYWEFDSIPESWVKQAAQVDEVWAATEFVAKGLRERLPLPVRTLFPGVKLGEYKKRPRQYFGLEPDKFTFLFTFHMMSIMERKNPLGLVRAFQLAFKPEEPVCLVLKTSFGDRHPTQLQELHQAAQGGNIRVIDAVYSPDEVLSLMDSCDAYVSLHRSEGLGLTMAEAMLMGKPVIGTNYSGNVDFMDESNSLLVPYTLKKLGRPIPPYDADSEWAEPSEEHAAQAMRRVFDNQAWARELGQRAQISALERLSLESAGRKVAKRLEEIRAERLEA